MAKSKKQIQRPETDEEKRIREKINAEQRRLRAIQSKADDEHRKQQNHIKIVAGAIALRKYPASEIITEMSDADAKKAREVYPDVFGSPDDKQECQQQIEEAAKSILSEDSRKKIQVVVDGAHNLDQDKLAVHRNRLVELSSELDNAHKKAQEAGEKAARDDSISGSLYSSLITKIQSLEADSKFAKESLDSLNKA